MENKPMGKPKVALQIPVLKINIINIKFVRI